MQKAFTYRFAFYGRSGSGKTCLLSALAMSHRPHPDGYTATRVPLEGPSANVSDIRRASREQGDHWIEAAVEALQRGELPRANQASDFVMTFEYEFTSPDRRTYRVELVDYSGELLNPRDLSDPDSLAAQLREHLKDMDGLLVLAEAPRAGETEHLSNELNLLRQAFVALRGERKSDSALDVPVALLVSKWDRQSDLTGQPTSDGELQKLDRFFDSPEHGEYRQLRNDLQNGVTDGNFRAFPVSALGPVTAEQREDGSTVERPAGNSLLQSFGMEDGFVWAARRCDALALRACEERALGLSWVWPPWRSGSGELAATAAHLSRRFPCGSSEQVRALSVARASRAKQLSRGLLTAATLLLATLGAESWLDYEAFRKGEAALADPTTNPETIAQHEQWLERYAASGTHRHAFSKFVVSGDDAYEKLRELRRSRVDADWRRVAAIEDVLEKAEAARKHLAKYKNSPHLNEVTELVEASDKLRETEKNAAWWELLSEDSSRALSNRSEEDLVVLLDRIDSPPHPDRETEAIHTKRTELRLQISKVLSEIAAEKEWSQFLVEYQEHLEAGRPLDAGALLAKRLQDRAMDDRLEQTCEQFREDLTKQLPNTMKELIRLNKWTDAKDLVRRLERDQALWPEELQPPGGKEFVSFQRSRVDEAYDQHLYDVLRRNRTTTAAQDYLDVAPLGAMRREAQQFKQWLAARGEKLKLTLVLTRIDWGRSAQHANDNHIIVRLNEETVGERTKVTSKANSSTGELLRHSFQAKLDEDIKLTVRIDERDFFGYHDNHGRGEQTVRVYDLAQGFSLPLRADKYSHTATFHLEGAPPEPKLPDWRSD